MTVPDSELRNANGASCLPCSPGEEKRIIADLTNEAESNLKEGNTYYVISNRWFASWEKYVGLENGEYLITEPASDHGLLNMCPPKAGDRPGPIDNSDIVLDGNELKSDSLELQRMLQERKDYVLVPQKVWEKFYEWYKGGPALPRKMISQGQLSKTFVVEVYPLSLNLIDSRDESQSVIRLSRKASVRELYDRVCSLKGITKEKACLWDYFEKNRQTKLVASDQTLEESNLQMDQDILLDVQTNGRSVMQDNLALVPLEPSTSSTIAGGATLSNGHSTGQKLSLYQGSAVNASPTDAGDRLETYSSSRKRERGGLAGLQNLGNTCFMNSALQCLVHTPPIVDYFLEDYSKEINTENPLGMHGELALAFGELLRKLWSPEQTAVAPRAFKAKLARFAPQFSGYNQHDSQELLAFLLDGLHEDLNRVKKKPYIEAKDSDDRPDEVVAEESWKYHRARNDSIIVDICQGQYKSTLVCPVCEKISITFDPFMYLTLPLPSTVTRTMTITVFHGDGSGLPMPYTVSVPKHGCCKDLIQALSSACCLGSNDRLLLAEVYGHRICRYLEIPMALLSTIKDEQHIVAYRLPKDMAGMRRLEIIHRWQEKSTVSNSKCSGGKISGTPLVTCIPEDHINDTEIGAAVSRVLLPLKRTYSSPSKMHSTKENGLLSESPYEPMSSSTENNSTIESLLSQSAIKLEPDGGSNGYMTFHLSLTDDKGTNCKPIEKDSLRKAGQLVRVMMDWTAKDHEVYDASYLNDLPEVHKVGFSMKKTRPEAASLYSCLDAFLTEEPLGPDDMWYCPRCKEHRQATKKLDLWRLPDILVFHLKRFSYSRYLKNKLDTFVNFPIRDLDLRRYVKRSGEEPYIYELYAISNHYGNLGGGHYTAYAKLIDENRWYHFDDSHVSAVSEGDVKTSAAYVLFYKRARSKSTAERMG